MVSEGSSSATSIKLLEKRVKIPEGVSVNFEGSKLEVEGPEGRCEKDFSKIPVYISLEGRDVVIKAYGKKKKYRAIVGTVSSLVKNMMQGVREPFEYRLKIVYAHFPVSVKVRGGKVLIENFIGEKKPRIAKMVGITKVEVEGDDVVIKGPCLEDVGQTAANIELATRIKKKDPRVFLDGIYIYKKSKRRGRWI